MERSVRTSFRSTRWEETELVAGEPRLTRASCDQTYTGDLTGSSTLEYLMAYRAGGAATFVGMERIDAIVAGRRGTFALRHVGTFEDGVARMALEIVEGSGTGELVGLSGGGEFESPHAESYEVTLGCVFRE